MSLAASADAKHGWSKEARTVISTSVVTSTSRYPVHVNAQLDARLSRGLWLVKWLLAIPHFIILAFLWLAFVVLSIVAFFAILFTARYPVPSSTSTWG
jgi:hypothetical protein